MQELRCPAAAQRNTGPRRTDDTDDTDDTRSDDAGNDDAGNDNAGNDNAGNDYQHHTAVRAPPRPLRSGWATSAPPSRLNRLAQCVHHQDHFAGERVELKAGQPLGDRDCLRRIVDQAAPTDVTTHDPHQAVVDRLVVDDDLGAALEQTVELDVEVAQPLAEVVDAGERAMQVRKGQLVVVVQVVRRRDDADEAPEAVLAQPDDLLLATDAAMVLAISARSLADGELVLHDPGEVARGDAQ